MYDFTQACSTVPSFSGLELTVPWRELQVMISTVLMVGFHLIHSLTLATSAGALRPQNLDGSPCPQNVSVWIFSTFLSKAGPEALATFEPGVATARALQRAL